MIAADASHYGCATHRERGSAVCEGIFVSRKAVDGRLLTEARDLLLAPERIAELQREVRQIYATKVQEHEAAGRSASGRIGEVNREIDNLVQATRR